MKKKELVDTIAIKDWKETNQRQQCITYKMSGRKTVEFSPGFTQEMQNKIKILSQTIQGEFDVRIEGIHCVCLESLLFDKFWNICCRDGGE